MRKKLFENDFYLIKGRIHSGSSMNDICMSTGFSLETVRRVKKSMTYDDYKELIARYIQKRDEKKAAKEKIDEQPIQDEEIPSDDGSYWPDTNEYDHKPCTDDCDVEYLPSGSVVKADLLASLIEAEANIIAKYLTVPSTGEKYPETTVGKKMNDLNKAINCFKKFLDEKCRISEWFTFFEDGAKAIGEINEALDSVNDRLNSIDKNVCNLLKEWKGETA